MNYFNILTTTETSKGQNFEEIKPFSDASFKFWVAASIRCLETADREKDIALLIASADCWVPFLVDTNYKRKIYFRNSKIIIHWHKTV